MAYQNSVNVRSHQHSPAYRSSVEYHQSKQTSPFFLFWFNKSMRRFTMYFRCYMKNRRRWWWWRTSKDLPKKKTKANEQKRKTSQNCTQRKKEERERRKAYLTWDSLIWKIFIHRNCFVRSMNFHLKEIAVDFHVWLSGKLSNGLDSIAIVAVDDDSRIEMAIVWQVAMVNSNCCRNDDEDSMVRRWIEGYLVHNRSNSCSME